MTIIQNLLTFCKSLLQLNASTSNLENMFISKRTNYLTMAGNFNPSPDMPVLGSSNSVANKDVMVKI